MLTIPQLPAFDIAEPEVVEVTVPAAAMIHHNADLRDVHRFTVLASAGRARLRGSLLDTNANTRLQCASIRWV